MSVQVEGDFFCCGPKIWTRAIGWLQLVCAIVAGVAGTAVIFMEVSEATEGKSDEVIERGNLYATIGVCVWWVVIGILMLLVSLLLIGNEKERAGLLWPWLIFSWIGTVSSGLGVIETLFRGEFELLGVMAVDAIVGGFFLYVVHQRRKEILANTRKETIVGVYAQF